MKPLLETYNQVKKMEKESIVPAILYKVYEQGKLIYIGIGGKGKRKGSGRLREHYKATMYSSFKFRYVYTEGVQKEIHWKEREAQWDNLLWDIEVGDLKSIEQREKELIGMNQPYYNIEFK